MGTLRSYAASPVSARIMHAETRGHTMSQSQPEDSSAAFAAYRAIMSGAWDRHLYQLLVAIRSRLARLKADELEDRIRTIAPYLMDEPPNQEDQ